MTLTPAEKSAGRAFRFDQAALLAARNRADPPGMLVKSLWHYVRHDCEANGGVSTALELKERYEQSPDYHVCDCGDVCCKAGASLKERDNCGPVPLVPPGRFGFIWREGKCSACGLTARSGDGRFVIASERPPDPRSHRGREARARR